MQLPLGAAETQTSFVKGYLALGIVHLCDLTQVNGKTEGDQEVGDEAGTRGCSTRSLETTEELKLRVCDETKVKTGVG